MPLMLLAEILEFTPELLVGILLLAAIVAAVVFWGALLARRRSQGSLLPCEPRRRVPWQAVDVLVVLVVYLVLSAVAAEVIRGWIGQERMEPLHISRAEASETAHPVMKVLATGDPRVLLLCVVSVVVVAPVVEEFLFRLLLQGWLEASMERWGPRLPTLRRLLPGASGPILCSSFLFGAAHFRVAGKERHVEFVVALLLANALVGTLLVAFAVFWVRTRRGATAADLGLVRTELAGDVRLGLWALVALLGPVYAIQIASHLIVPKYIAPDPIPLFFLAVGLGVLYARTHRIVPCIVLHAALNAVSLALAWGTLQLGAQ